MRKVISVLFIVMSMFGIISCDPPSHWDDQREAWKKKAEDAEEGDVISPPLSGFRAICSSWFEQM